MLKNMSETMLRIVTEETYQTAVVQKVDTEMSV